MFIVMPPEFYEYTYYFLMLTVCFSLGIMYLMVYFDFETWLSKKRDKEE